MKEMSGLNAEAVMEYGNIYRGIYLIVISEDKEQMIDGLKEYGFYDNYKSQYPVCFINEGRRILFSKNNWCKKCYR